MKYKPGDMVPATVMEAVTGEPINLPDQEWRHSTLKFPTCGLWTWRPEARVAARKPPTAPAPTTAIFKYPSRPPAGSG
jgi:hypothetical protein